MRNLILAATLLATFAVADAQTPKFKEEIRPYVEFLENEKPASAKDYIISLFEDHDLVILCERDHRDVTQYDLILDVMRDRYFIENVGMVFTEVGARTLDRELNEFLRNDTLSDEEVERRAVYLQRNVSFPIWAKTNFIYFIKGIHEINKNLPADKKLEVHPTDIYYIDGEPTEEKYAAIFAVESQRDKLMADFIIENFDAIKKENPSAKALVIMNYRHAYNYCSERNDGPPYQNTGYFLFDHYPDRVANVLINQPTDNSENDELDHPLQDGKWDAAFEVMGIENTGFDFADTPFGSDGFDHWAYPNDKKYEDVFDGFVFYLPYEKFELWIGYDGLIDDEYMVKLSKSLKAYFNARSIESGPDVIPAAEIDRYIEGYREYNSLIKYKEECIEECHAAINQWLEPK